MNESEFKALRQAEQKPEPSVSAIQGPDRTLLYGYDTDRNTWHVYQEGGILNLLVYSGAKVETARLMKADGVEDFRQQLWLAERNYAIHLSGESLPCSILVPNKRLYPEACDAAFSQLMLSLGQDLPFTNFNPDREAKDFHGWQASAIEPYEPPAPAMM